MTVNRQFWGLSAWWVRVLIGFVFVWGLLVFLFASKLGSSLANSDAPESLTMTRLNEAMNYLEHSKQRNAEIRKLIDELLNDQSQSQHHKKLIEEIEKKLGQSTYNFADANGDYSSSSSEPSLEYEQLRRRIRTNIQELWNFVNSEITSIRGVIVAAAAGDLSKRLVPKIDVMLEATAERKRSLLNDMDRLQLVDGYQSWRKKEADALSDLVQKRLMYLQHPADCEKGMKLVCRLNKGCGYGCQLHHVIYCFITAYATERTLILKSTGWRYHRAGWEEVFQPLSESCNSADGATHGVWASNTQNVQVIDMPIIDVVSPRPAQLPLAIPEDLAPRLQRLHGNPIVWWVGQFLKYMLRTQPETADMLETGMRKHGFRRPIVGVHVRRTDKIGTEASLHTIDEYMRGVADYFEQLEQIQPVDKRRVFLASDDPKVIHEARKKYPEYDIIGDADVARMAAVSTRYTDSALNGIILDIHMLSLSDHLVCTFSSQVCRLAYEIMQTMHPDATTRFQSLDDIYYYGGQNAHNQEVVIAHTPLNLDELHLKVGDIIGVAGNHWDGFSKGKNLRTNRIGLFPSFKVIDKIEAVDFPKYSNIE